MRDVTGRGRSDDAPRRASGARVAVAAVVVVVAAVLVAGGVLVVRPGSADAPGAGLDGELVADATDEIVRGDLQEETTVAGTLRYAGAYAVRAGTDGVVTALPEPGTVLVRGDVVGHVGNVPSYLLTGVLPAWRDFGRHMDDGPDVRQLEENLRDLGHLAQEPDDRFRWATEQAVMAWQEANGLPRTGRLPLGSVVFLPGDVRVGEVGAGVGAPVQEGEVLYEATGTTQVVEAVVRLADQQLAVLDGPVTVRLPGGASTTGRITSVGTPTEADGANGQKVTVVPVVVSLDDPAHAAGFQQASVSVDLPSERREDVLSVPVGALLALSPQQFGVELVAADGSTSRVPVTTGLFAGGRVEISGDAVEAGRRVVVPRR